MSMFNKKMKRIVTFILIGFIILFLLRLAFDSFINPTSSGMNFQESNLVLSGTGNVITKFDSVKNYATLNFSKDVGAQSTALIVQQKYEKIASLSSRSNNFDSDQKEINNVINKNSALIQYNQFSGLEGNRLLQIAIGVDPDQFDNIVEMLKKIGKPESISISKFDKTNEYKDLQAKKKLLEDTKSEFVSLKSKAQKVDESINVQNKITEINNEIQQLGLNLEEYNSNISLCTIKYTLQEQENKQLDSRLKLDNVLKNIFESFEWTIHYYSLALIILLLANLIALCLLKVYEKFLAVKTKLDSDFYKKNKADI